jgi:hypothetical protein
MGHSIFSRLTEHPFTTLQIPGRIGVVHQEELAHALQGHAALGLFVLKQSQEYTD